MSLPLPDESVPNEEIVYRWTMRRIFIAVSFVLVLFFGFFFVLSNADADDGYEERQRDRYMERLVKAEEDQAKALEAQTKVWRELVKVLKRIERKME